MDDGPVAPGEPRRSATAGDPGLAAERTDIAWARSGLAVVVCLAAIMRRVPAMQASHRWAVFAVLPVGVAIVAAVTARSQHHAASTLPEIDTTALRLRSVAWSIVAVGVLCLVVVALGAW
jgi:hypothetical protein